MHPAQRRSELPDEVVKRRLQRGAPSDQHVIVAGVERLGRGETDHLAQAPPHAVAFHGIADLARYGKADPARASVAARTRLQDESAGGRPRAGGGSPKIRPASQPFHSNRFAIRFGLAIGCGNHTPADRALKAYAL